MKCKIKMAYLACKEDAGWRHEEGVHGVEGVLGVEALEEHGGRGDHLLPELQLLTQHL